MVVTESLPQLKTPPTSYPVTLDEVKFRLGIVDDDSQNDDLRGIIAEATDMVQRDARRYLMPQTWEWSLDTFPCSNSPIEIRKVPVISLTFLKYYIGGVLTTLSSSLYEVDTTSEPCRIEPVFGQLWPTTDIGMRMVRLEWVSGYSTAAALKQKRAAAKSAVLLKVKQLYRDEGCGARYDELIGSLQTLGFHR